MCVCVCVYTHKDQSQEPKVEGLDDEGLIV